MSTKQGKSDYEELAKALSELPNTEETRRKALLLKEFLVEDELSKRRVADIENGVYRDTLSAEESALAEKLFNNIKTEFRLDTQKDLMDLWLMVAFFVRSKRFLRAKAADEKQAKTFASVVKSFADSYSSLARELGLSRQQRLVRRVSKYEDNGSLTQLFAGIEQVELDTPAKRVAKKDKKKKKKKKEAEEVTA